MLLVDGNGIPLTAMITSASHHEVTLIEKLIDGRITRRKPKRLLYDLAADSDPLRSRLKARRIELICPHRANRKRAPTQDGRAMRRYKRRYRVERTISWLFNFRRLVVRYEHKPELFLSFVQLASLITILRGF